MTRLLKKCSQCNTYTMKAKCPRCGGIVVNAHPARFSIEDRYGSYRRAMKKELLAKHKTDTDDKAT